MELILAPLMGITTLEFRQACARCFPGAFDRALAPFISISAGVEKARPRYTDINPAANAGSLVLEPQVLGLDGKVFVAMARRLGEDLGYTRCNWNIGCPSPTVTAKRRGAGILPHPDLIAGFLDQACAQPFLSLGVKTRLGMHSINEWPAVARVLGQYPLGELCIHPRTGLQQYEGRADRQAFREAATLVPCPLVYNGDLNTLEDWEEVKALGCSLAGLMLGRGFLRDPWLPARIRQAEGWNPPSATRTPATRPPAPQSPEFFQGLGEFHQVLCEILLSRPIKASDGHRQNQSLLLVRMKELWRYWASLFPPESPLVRRVLRTRDTETYLAAAAQAWNQ